MLRSQSLEEAFSCCASEFLERCARNSRRARRELLLNYLGTLHRTTNNLTEFQLRYRKQKRITWDFRIVVEFALRFCAENDQIVTRTRQSQIIQSEIGRASCRERV